jgi:endoglucanase
MEAPKDDGGQSMRFANLRRASAVIGVSVLLAACGGGGDGDVTEPADRSDAPEVTANAPEEAVPFYIDSSQSFYANVEDTLQSGEYPELSDEMEELLETPVATWLGEWLGTNEEVKDYVAGVSNDAASKGEMPVFVLYNIPDRDLGEFSAGGLDNASTYLEWVKSISEGVGNNRALFILEPDALAGVPEMDDTDGQARIKLLRDTLTLLSEGNPNAEIYLDGGHDAWLEAQELADLLKQVDNGTGVVKGISLNVSSFGTTEVVIAYSEEVIDLYGVSIQTLIDIGLSGSDVELNRADWCNNRDIEVGVDEADDEYDPADPVIELTVKPPGESGGECDKGDPEAGEFDPDLLATQLGQPSGRYSN